MYLEFTDEALVSRLKSDDPVALETLFNRYYKSLCHFCCVYTKDHAVAEEIVADLFIRLWDNRKETTILKVRNYLFVSARNLSLNYTQKKKNPVNSFEDLDVHEQQHQVLQDHNTPFDILSGREASEHLIYMINKLPKRQREVLLMSRVDHLDKHTISQLLGISVRTVETTLYQSIHQLRTLLKQSPDI